VRIGRQRWTGPWRAAVGLCGVLTLFSLFTFWHQQHGQRAEAASPAAGYSLSVVPPAEVAVPATASHPAYTLYTPGGLGGAPPSPITLVVLHGMGGNGPGMAAPLLPLARSQGWNLIAPTIPYGEWRDPNQLTGEELGLQPQLANLLEGVGAETGVPVGPRVLFFGFSRGAQAALRFAMLYPDRVEAVAAFSAGTYTLPTTSVKTAAGGTLAAPLPFGVADLEQRAGWQVDPSRMSAVRFLIGVGSRDNREGDVPRQWDPFVGKNRVERAERYAASLSALGLPAQVVVVPDAGHELSAAMMTHVSAFLTAAAADLQAQIAAATTTEPVARVLPPGSPS
jgi:predicted esterase